MVVIILVLAFFAFSRNLVDLPLCPSAFLVDKPCPLCGTTRSVASIFNGNFLSAWSLNPIGYLVVFLLVRRVIVLCFTDYSFTRHLEGKIINTALLVFFFLFLAVRTVHLLLDHWIFVPV
ncbi:MAG: DUF2752 domain-containing protein [Candidatus Sumerlaeia bacterium]|nr:DUF2752 domain-containing protein [Candidatus Sumerlaeia bacterium]